MQNTEAQRQLSWCLGREKDNQKDIISVKFLPFIFFLKVVVSTDDTKARILIINYLMILMFYERFIIKKMLSGVL